MSRYDLTAQDIMQIELATILSDATIADAARQMRLEGVRSLIVEPFNEQDPPAILTYTDIIHKVLAEGLEPETILVESIMTKPLVTIPPEMRVEFIAKLFRQTRIGHAPVINCGKLVGIISATDLITEVIIDPE